MTETHTLPFPEDVLLEHRAWVRALARSLVRDPAAAEDLEQDTWVRALESMPSETRSPRAWLATVLRNRFRDNLRTRERRAGRERRAARTGAHRAAADIAMAAELHREVLDAVLALDQPFRDVVLLRYFEALTPAEIAERQGVPAATVRTRLHRGLGRLREGLGRSHGEDGWKTALAPLLSPAGAGGPHPHPPRKPWHVPVAVGAGAAAVAVVVLVALTVWSATPSRPRPAFAVAATAPAADAPAAAPATDRPPRRDRDRVMQPFRDSADAGGTTVTAGSEDTSAPAATAALVRVAVVDEADAPVAGARVQVVDGNSFAKAGFGRTLSSSESDAQGGVTFEHPGADEVRIVARAGDRAGITAVLSRADALAAASQVRLTAASSLRGVIVSSDGSPVVGARVAMMLTGDVFGPGGAVVTGKDGTFSFATLPHDAFTTPANLEIVAPGFPHTNQPATRADVTGSGMRIELTPAIALRGRCVDAGGQPVAAVWVSCSHAVSPVETAADGAFYIAGIDVSGARGGAPVLSFECDSHAPRRIELDEHLLTTGAIGDVVLEEGRTMHGRVVDRDGRPVPRASVYAEGLDTLQIARQGQTDDDGRFVFEHVGDEPHDIVAQGPDDDSFSGLAGVLRDVHPSGDEVVVTISGALTVLVEFVDAKTSESIALTNVLVLIEPLTGDEDDEAGAGLSSEDGFRSVRIRAKREGPYKMTVRSFDGWGEFVVERVDVNADEEIRVKALLERR